jgi:hypothetical protein
MCGTHLRTQRHNHLDSQRRAISLRGASLTQPKTRRTLAKYKRNFGYLTIQTIKITHQTNIKTRISYCGTT